MFGTLVGVDVHDRALVPEAGPSWHALLLVPLRESLGIASNASDRPLALDSGVVGL